MFDKIKEVVSLEFGGFCFYKILSESEIKVIIDIVMSAFVKASKFNGCESFDRTTYLKIINEEVKRFALSYNLGLLAQGEDENKSNEIDTCELANQIIVAIAFKVRERVPPFDLLVLN